MPIYEYQCLKCGNKFEHLQKIHEDDLTVCPNCQAPKLQRLISNTSFQLKGSGWYVTDYKNKDANTKAAQNLSEKKDGDNVPAKTETTTPVTKSADSAEVVNSAQKKPEQDKK